MTKYRVNGIFNMDLFLQLKGECELKRLKILLSVFLCVVFVFSGCLSVCAATERTFDLEISSTTAIPGDTVVFNLDVKNNPGIMAVTFTVHYDPEVLEYENYIAGILSRDTSARHDGYVSIVFCGLKDRVGDGTLYGFQFKVKDTAKAGFSAVTIKNIRPTQYGDSLSGCFANWNGDKLTPTLKSGGVDIGFTGSNCNHTFGDWETVVPAACKTAGVQSHTCKVCGHNAQQEISATGHNYAENWTIDRAATSLNDGLMTRHCTGVSCDATSDPVTFTLRDAEGNGFANAVGTVIRPNSWKPLEEIIEQTKQPDVPEHSEDNTEPPELLEKEPDNSDEIDNNVEDEKEFIEEDIPIAGDLVESAKKEESTLVKVHSYLFGVDEQVGIIKLISDGFADMFSNLFGGFPALLLLVVFVIV